MSLDTGLGRLGAAVAAFDSARRRATEPAGAVIDLAEALDAADAACATGSTKAATAARTTARAFLGPGGAALASLPARLAGYARAATALAGAAGAASSLAEHQRQALAAVVAGSRVETGAIEAFRVAAVSAWPSYSTLYATQARWLDRRLAGWYRDQREAAAAYAVFVDTDRPRLAAARSELARTDRLRRAAAGRESSALAGADAALSSLRSAG